MSIPFKSTSNILNLDSQKTNSGFDDFFKKDLKNIHGTLRRLSDDNIYPRDIESIILIQDSNKMSSSDLQNLSRELQNYKSQIVIIVQKPSGINSIGRAFTGFKVYLD